MGNFFFQNLHTICEAHHAYFSTVTRSSLLGLKWTEREDKLSQRPSVETKKNLSYNSSSALPLFYPVSVTQLFKMSVITIQFEAFSY